MERYESLFERTSLNKFEVELLMNFDKALFLLNKTKSYFISNENIKESTIRDEKNFDKTLKQAYDLLFKISEKIKEIKNSSLQDYSLTFAVEVIYRCTGHKFTNFVYTANIKNNLKSLIIDLDNMIRDVLNDVLLGSIKSEYYKICTHINDFIVEYNEKFKVKNYKELLIPYEVINYFHKK